MTAPQRQISVPDPSPAAGRLRVRRIDLADRVGADGALVDPLALLAALPTDRRHALWRPPAEAAANRSPESLLGIGTALRLVAPPVGVDDGPARAVAELGEMVRRAFAERVERDGGARGDDRGLRAFFTVAFDPADAFDGAAEAARWHGFAPVEAVVPEILVRFRASGGAAEAVLVGTQDRLATLAAELDGLLDQGVAHAAPGDDRPGDLEIEWAAGRHRRAVEAALEALADPELSKVVLAHGVDVRRRRPFAPAELLDTLRTTYPGCFLFSFRAGVEPGSDGKRSGRRHRVRLPDPPEHGPPAFLGASPERLALVEYIEDGKERRGPGGPAGALRVLSGALAGTAPRGRTLEEERRFGEQLLASAKDRQEHAIVEEMIAEALAPLCSHLERGGEPELERLDNVQHLYTPVTGTLRPGRTLFDAVAALHPTPAVGGMPRDRAMAAIRTLEPRPRGLYAGVVGWVDAAGHGDSAVAIRSALVGGAEGEAEGRALLYAGGGIVPTSDPDVEVEEIRLKLSAVLGAMKAPQDE